MKKGSTPTAARHSTHSTAGGEARYQGSLTSRQLLLSETAKVPKWSMKFRKSRHCLCQGNSCSSRGNRQMLRALPLEAGSFLIVPASPGVRPSLPHVLSDVCPWSPSRQAVTWHSVPRLRARSVPSLPPALALPMAQTDLAATHPPKEPSGAAVGCA